MNSTDLFLSKNLSLSFGKDQESYITAVNKTNITIPESEITIIYGASGSGKSSLLNIFSGLQAPTSGQLLYKGENLYEKTKNELAYFRAKELGIVYQSNYWVKSLNVIDNVSLPLFFMGLSKIKAHERALESLKIINMESYAKKFPILLSGGEQQRIAMARAIIADPPVIVADEPTGNLDSKNGDMIIDLLKQLNKNNKKTVILVTHNMEYLSIATNLLEIHDGNVVQISKNDIGKTVKAMLKETQNRITSMIEKDKDGK